MSLAAAIQKAADLISRLAMSRKEQAIIRLLERCVGYRKEWAPEDVDKAILESGITVYVMECPSPGSSWVIATRDGQLIDREEIR